MIIWQRFTVTLRLPSATFSCCFLLQSPYLHQISEIWSSCIAHDREIYMLKNLRRLSHELRQLLSKPITSITDVSMSVRQDLTKAFIHFTFCFVPTKVKFYLARSSSLGNQAYTDRYSPHCC